MAEEDFSNLGSFDFSEAEQQQKVETLRRQDLFQMIMIMIVIVMTMMMMMMQSSSRRSRLSDMENYLVLIIVVSVVEIIAEMVVHTF